jgi:hypothetical protein
MGYSSPSGGEFFITSSDLFPGCSPLYKYPSGVWQIPFQGIPSPAGLFRLAPPAFGAASSDESCVLQNFLIPITDKSSSEMFGPTSLSTISSKSLYF